MTDGLKLTGAERRKHLLAWLKESEKPLTGSELAKKASVSRQVIVQDISLLKAKNEPIIATSQGYMYLRAQASDKQPVKRIIACDHDPGKTEEELNMIVDFGVTVKDVTIEHPVYGDLTASIRVSTRKEVADFVKKISSTNAAYLSQLTNGIHLHTLEADGEEKIEQACDALKKAGILIQE
ncbi:MULTISPECIES: transcription repressor NadR [Bacillus]|uniref:Transcription repressor NadR n=1 Tax=Bacillus glycinifermentans TaxID=1664069 RepID=A0AAJ3Z111_9BACI|nr:MULTISPECIES: transcription repressor NadR [Bacillus]KKB72584.1 transcriptional regulator [Bacillus sp. TH008]MBU8786854.1 transcription repressor NadR [Bacillus glycinifermentans]MDU0069958.1 transcription repressor NadR [Bacillus sp. IG6]MED8017631.1 transcription repressor NadR [Bacillus glycinifermentans]NUJ16086.1 transcription repressor NadR [Bacillus glycinifermentans]